MMQALCVEAVQLHLGIDEKQFPTRVKSNNDCAYCMPDSHIAVN